MTQTSTLIMGGIIVIHVTIVVILYIITGKLLSSELLESDKALFNYFNIIKPRGPFAFFRLLYELAARSRSTTSPLCKWSFLLLVIDVVVLFAGLLYLVVS